jgi:hypothetical protein
MFVNAAAQDYFFSNSALVDHPALHPVASRTISSYKSGVGTWGEQLIEELIKKRGFNEIYEVKNSKNNGIDRIAIKRKPNGEILEVKFVEVKTSRSPKPKLIETRTSGTQMSRKWLADKLNDMRRTGDPELRKLALETSRFHKASGLNLMSSGEVIHINTKTDKLVTYAADGRTVKAEMNVTRLLTTLQKRGSTPEMRSHAVRQLAMWDQIKATSQSSYLGRSATQQAKNALVEQIARSGSDFGDISDSVSRQSRSKQVTALVKRSAGRIAVVVSLAIDAKELFDIEYAYRSGTISLRQRNTQIASKIGGMAGAAAGASAGAMTGAWIGTAGGPFAWITVPTGAIVGSAVGGAAGYWGGSTVATMGANAWYDSIDFSVKERVEIAWLQSKGSFDD